MSGRTTHGGIAILAALLAAPAALAQARPDLVYDHCASATAPQTSATPVRVMLYMRNTSAVANAVFFDGYTAFRVTRPNGSLLTQQIPATTVLPGQVKGWTYFEFDPAGKAPGTYDYGIDVDPANRVAESSDGNNHGVCRVVVAPAPNLNPRGCTVSAPFVDAATPFDVRFDLRNTGGAPAMFTASAWSITMTPAAGGAARTFPQATAGSQTFAAGSTTAMTRRFTAQADGLAPGVYNVSVAADPNGAVQEIDENDNVALCPQVNVIPPPAQWSFPLVAGANDYMVGWFVRQACASAAEPYIALTDMPSRPTCPNPMANGVHILRHTYVSGAGYWGDLGAVSAHGDPARACAGWPRLCAAIGAQNRFNRLSVGIGRLALTAAAEPAGAWDQRSYAGATDEAIQLKYDGVWFAQGRLTGTERIANPANGCSAAITVDGTITWVNYAANAIGGAFRDDVAASGRPTFLLHADSPVQQIVVLPDQGCRSVPGRFTLGTGYLRPN